MGSSGSQQPVTQQTQQTKDPWGPAQPYLQQAMGSSQGLFNADIGYQPFTGLMTAPINPGLQGPLSQLATLYNQAPNGTAGVNAGRTLGTSMIQNQGLSPELRSLYEQAQGDQNPYLEATIRQQVNAANAAASAGGRYGSGGHDAAITQAMAPTLAQDYARRQDQMQKIAAGGLERAGQWAQLMPTLDEARLAGAQGLANIGQFYQERDQKAIEDQMKVYNAQQARPWEQLARYNAIVGGAGGLGGSMSGTSTTPINQPSTLQRLFGGAAAGAGLGGMFGGPLGAGAGALGGGLLGLL